MRLKLKHVAGLGFVPGVEIILFKDGEYIVFEGPSPETSEDKIGGMIIKKGQTLKGLKIEIEQIASINMEGHMTSVLGIDGNVFSTVEGYIYFELISTYGFKHNVILTAGKFDKTAAVYNKLMADVLQCNLLTDLSKYIS